MATLKNKVNPIIEKSLSSMAVMVSSETLATSTTSDIIAAFQQWLLDQAEKDSPKDFRNTRAYNLYERLRKE
ncbi:hypothetical protein LCGC14_1384480 [marine sediment metagenome]|uniref:Uncharacterized protein n=1 Tax=marine sediment metagenome TaxID=412755 RepID=A0A0F9N3A6_9ZZZZ